MQDYVFRHFENSPGKRRAHRSVEPCLQIRPLGRHAQQVDSESELGDGDDAYKQTVRRLTCHEGYDAWVRCGSAEFGENVRVDKQRRYQLNSRTGR